MTEDERKAFDDWWNAPYGNYSVRCEFPLNETDAAWMAWQAQAEEITRLRTALADREAKLEKAREALRPFARLSHFVGDCGVADEGYPGNTAIIEAELFKQAATTLKDIT